MASQHSVSAQTESTRKRNIKPCNAISGLEDGVNCELDDASVKIQPDEKLTDAEAEEAVKSLEIIHDLKFFLLTAPVNWHENQVIRRYYLNKEEGFVSCVYWNNLYFITGTDIVRSVAYKLELFGRKIVDRKKLEEGIFSDLRALKCGTSAVLEMPKSKFLRFLHRNQCLRTQKKQKVFFWFSVPHDRLFRDALARDLERELNGIPGATVSDTKLSRTFHYDHTKGLIPQLRSHIFAQTGKDFIYILSDTQEDPATEAAESNKSIQNDKTSDVHGETSETKTEISSTMDNMYSEKEKSKAESSPDFPLDYIQNDPFLFNVDGVGSVAEGNDFTYVQNPSSAFQPDQPALWLISPQGLGISDDLLLDQATPVVPVFNTASPAHLRLPWSSFAPHTSRSLWSSGVSPSQLGPQGIAMLTTQPKLDPRKGRHSVALKTSEESDKKVKVENDKAKPPQCLYTFVPGASSLSSSGLSATSLRGNIEKDDENYENEAKQVLTVPTLPTGGESTFSAVLSPMIDTTGDNLRYYYGASPYFADFPSLPFSRPYSAIKSSSESKRDTSQSLNTTKNGYLKNKVHAVEGGRISKPKKNHLLNPSLRHLDLDLDLSKNAVWESNTGDIADTETDSTSNRKNQT